jgi:putative endopeptidase
MVDYTLAKLPGGDAAGVEEGKDGYYTFEVHAVRGGAGARSATKRRVAAAVAGMCVAAVCVIVLAVTAQPAPSSFAESGQEESLVAWGHKDRTMFLRELKTAFPSTMLSAMDFSVDPCDNFFEYSCGDWQKLATIPPELGGVAKSWDAAQDAADSDLHKIMLKEYPKDSVYRKVHNWFKSCMDTEAVKDKGATPLKPWLSKVEAIDSDAKMWDTMVLFELWAIPTMIKLSVSADEKEPLKHDLFFESAGLVLPDYTYYDEDGDDEAKKHVAALREYLTTITELAGYSREEAELSANRTVEIERLLAQFQSDEPYEAIEDSYMHMNMTALLAHAPNIPWKRYFAGLRTGCEMEGEECLRTLGDNNNMVMDAPYFYLKLSEAFGNNSYEYWKPYLRTHVIYNLSPLLPPQFLNATFKLDAHLDGIQKQPARWHKCVMAVQHGLPALTDQLYTKEYFPASAEKTAMTVIVSPSLGAIFLHNLCRVGRPCACRPGLGG